MQRINIELYYCDPRHSSTNGQIERAHSTLVEIARCIKNEYHILDTTETFYRAAQKYNMTIHSVTDKTPFDVFFNKKPHSDLPEMLRKAQRRMLERNKPTQIRTYQPDEEVYEKLIGQRNKLDNRYKRQQVKEDLGNKIRIVSRNRLIHKENIKT